MNFVVPQKKPKYFCEICDYSTIRNSQYERHLLTSKHISINKKIQNYTKKDGIQCECGKTYKYHSGLWRHKKLCNKHNVDEIKNNISEIDNFQEKISDKELIMLLLKENKEFKELIINQSSKMLELATKPTTNVTNNNCTNQQFNLNVFLNEKCKNAMNMSDFVDSLEIMDDDFEDIGKLGYVQGISNILIKGLKDLDETIRPLHCSDIKRETLYIKDNDTWNKDENNQKIIEAINGVSHKNVKYIPIWRDANPEALDGTTKKNEQYMRIVNQVMTSVAPDDHNGFNKIIRNVANRVIIDKE